MPRANYGDAVRLPSIGEMVDEAARTARVQPQPATAESVISPYHPINARRHRNHNEGGNYVYRQRNLKLNFTLGWELEANHVPTRIPSGVEHISDGSVDGDGAEFVVLPAVTKSPRYVLGLLKDLVHAPKLNTNKSCGFHVHISASNLSSLARMRQWAIATEHLALQVEDLAFRAVPDARHGNEYCRRIVPISSGTSFSASKYSNQRRYHWLNIVEMFRPNGIRTIEVRLLGNTHRWKYLLAWTLFSMELARRGWDVANKPFQAAGHVDALGQMLQRIAKDIRPLEKKLEPIPQWVYDGLKTFGIEENAWERPLARLAENEANLSGIARPVYSDNQPEEMTSRRDDDDNDDYCPCGCDTEGRCDQQQHDDGDCDSAYCYPCHSEGNCGGLDSGCDWCIERAHEDGEDCQRRQCATCHPQPRVRPATSSGTSTGRVTTSSGPIEVHPSNVPEPSMLVHPNTLEAVQAFVNETRNAQIDNTMLQVAAYDAMVRGEGVASIVYDEAAEVLPMQSAEIDGRVWMTNVSTPDFFGPSIVDIVHANGVLEVSAAEVERLCLSRMTDDEMIQSADRGAFYNWGGR